MKQDKRKLNRSPYGTWKCNRCNLIFETRKLLHDHNHEFHPIPKGSSWNKGLTKETDSRVKKYSQTFESRYAKGEIIRVVSDKTRKKLSKSLKLAIKEGRAKGWQSRKIESYAESFFKNVLKNNGIKFSFNVPIKKKELGIQKGHCYFLDFVLDNRKIDLEIDGSQHKLDERKQSDIVRDNALIANGWKVYRIEWNKLKSNIEKTQMKQKIDKFLEWYKNA